MRIGINAQLLLLGKSPRNTGVSTYLYNLIDELAKIDSQNEYFIFVNNTFKHFVHKKNFHFIQSRINTVNPQIRVFWEQLILPILLLRYKIDLFHSGMNILPLFCPVKAIVTMHDLVPIKSQETRDSKRNLYHNLLTKISVKRAKKIIAVSESVKEGMIKYFKIPPKQISVIYEAASDLFNPLNRKTVDVFLKKRKIDFPFIFFVGTIEPRKNVTRIIEAYAKLKKEHKIREKFIIAGSKGWRSDEVFDSIEKFNLQGDVSFIGPVDHSEVKFYYNGAEAFVFPSLHEGFGLPVLEAMAYGCPVITSNVSSLPEVAGDAAIRVNPNDVNELASAMKSVLTNDKLRKQMIEKGLIQAKRFSWQKAALETLGVYKEFYA